MLLDLTFIVFGFLLLILGANLLVDGSVSIARRLGLPDRVTGLTVVAVGTAAPELVVSVTSAIEGHADMAFGNVAGSCLANLLLILGLSAVITPLRLSRRTQRFEIPASIVAIGALVLMANTAGGLDAGEGALLIALFLVFMAYTVVVGLREGADAAAEDAARAGTEKPQPDEEPGVLGRILDAAGARLERVLAHPVGAVAGLAIGIALLKIGADLVVDGSVTLAGAVGISERVIGITVVALGTCLPELITSVVAAFRGNTDLAVGNVVGSNVTNVALVMGLPALFARIPYDTAYNLDFTLLAIFTAVLAGFAFIGPRHVMSRRNGVAFAVLYVAYLGVAILF